MHELTDDEKQFIVTCLNQGTQYSGTLPQLAQISAMVQSITRKLTMPPPPAQAPEQLPGAA